MSDRQRALLSALTAGGTRDIRMTDSHRAALGRPSEKPCPACNGSGRYEHWDGTDMEACSDCEGTGNYPIPAPAPDDREALAQDRIDLHMRRVASRVMDVFENADDDALAEDVQADVYSAIGLLSAYATHLSPAPVCVGADERTDLARTIWDSSRADEGTISATGANIVADAIIAAGFRRHPEPVKPSREDVARVLAADLHHFTTADTWGLIPEAGRDYWRKRADAVLALWPTASSGASRES